MANNLNVNPLYFDTAGATSARTQALNITSIVWDSGDSGTVGDNLVIHDAASGNVVFQATLAVAKDTIVWAPAKPLNVAAGLYLTTMDNGVLLVYIT